MTDTNAEQLAPLAADEIAASHDRPTMTESLSQKIARVKGAAPYGLDRRHIPELRSMIDELAAERAGLRDALNLLVGYALTARSDSTAWLEGLAYRINRAAEVLGDEDRAVVERDGLRVVRGGASVESEGA